MRALATRRRIFAALTASAVLGLGDLVAIADLLEAAHSGRHAAGPIDGPAPPVLDEAARTGPFGLHDACPLCLAGGQARRGAQAPSLVALAPPLLAALLAWPDVERLAEPVRSGCASPRAPPLA